MDFLFSVWNNLIFSDAYRYTLGTILNYTELYWIGGIISTSSPETLFWIWSVTIDLLLLKDTNDANDSLGLGILLGSAID